MRKNNDEYLVSICVPIYGVEKYIERCVTSLFEQTYTNIEYIFVNDKTPDMSINILKSVIEKYPERSSHVHIINHKYNSGLAAARNTAVDAATGLFLFHVDSDDWLDKNCIKLCVEKQKETQADIVSTSILRIYKHSKKIETIPDFTLPKDFIISIITHSIPNNVWARLIRRSLYVDNGIKVEGGANMSEDLNVMPRLAYYSKQISTVHNALYFYECRNNNSYTSFFSENKFDQIMVTDKVLSDFFKGKGHEYEEALKIRLYNTFVRNLINSVKVKGNKIFYNKLRKKITSMPIELQKTLPFPYKLSLKIKNYYIFRWYILFASYIKKAIKR